MRARTTVYIVSTETPSSLINGNVSRSPGLQVEPVNVAVPDTEDGTLITMPPELGAVIVSKRKDNKYQRKI